MLLVAPITAWAGTVKYNGYLANESGLTYAKSYPLPMNQIQADNVSFQLTWSTPSPSNVTFTDGSESTGTLKVANNTGISSATASDFLTVLSTNLAGACITFFNGSAGQNVCNGNWRVDVTSDTAADIVTQLNALFTQITSTSNLTGSVVFSTATQPGSFGNRMTFTSNTSSITVNSLNFTGGTDLACFAINGIELCGGNQFAVGTSSAITANNIATAIDTNTALSAIVIATAPVVCGLANACGVVVTTSTSVGTNTNYVVYTTTQAALTIGGSTVTVTGLNGAGQGQMWGGTNAAYTLVGGSATVINATNTFGSTTQTGMVGYQVLYTTSSATAIGGLVWGTTYYVIPVSPSALGLATTSANAQKGTFIVLTSSTNKTTADSFVLTALPETGTATGIFQASNDGVNWTQYPGQGVSTFTAVFPSSTSVVDLGQTGYSWIRFNVNTPPTQGGLGLQIIPNAKNSGL